MVAALVDSVRPALPFICAPIPNSLERGSKSFSRVRGVDIASGRIGRTTLGFHVYLAEDGSFFFVSGLCEQSNIPEGEVFSVEITPASLRDFVASFDARDFPLLMDYVASALDRAMDAQLLGKLEKRTEEFREMAADLRALARLATPRVASKSTSPRKTAWVFRVPDGDRKTFVVCIEAVDRPSQEVEYEHPVTKERRRVAPGDHWTALASRPEGSVAGRIVTG